MNFDHFDEFGKEIFEWAKFEVDSTDTRKEIPVLFRDRFGNTLELFFKIDSCKEAAIRIGVYAKQVVINET